MVLYPKIRHSSWSPPWKPQILHSINRLDSAAEKYKVSCEVRTWFYTPKYDILHGHSHENLKSYRALTGWTLQRRSNKFPVRYELGVIPQKTTFFMVTAMKTSNLTNTYLSCLIWYRDYWSVTRVMSGVTLGAFMTDNAFCCMSPLHGNS
jgi:hypothetical protein